MNTAPKESTLEPYYIPTGPEPMTPVDTPVVEPPIKVTPVTVTPITATPDTDTPVLPASPTNPVPFSDPKVEMDYYAVSCKVLAATMSYVQNTLAVIKNSEQVTYYNSRLADIQKAYNSQQCGVTDIVDINNPATVTNPDAGNTTTTTNTPASTTDNTQSASTTGPSSTTTVVTPTAAPAPSAGGGGGGGGGGDDQKKPAPAAAAKKRNWWLIGGCILVIAASIYMDRKETI